MTADPVVFNPFDPSFRADPYPNYRTMREQDPYHRSPFGMLVLSRYEDCAGILRNPRMSSDERKSSMYAQWLAEAEPDPRFEGLEDARPFLFQDPPDHTRLRGLVSKAFTPRMVEQLRPRIETVVEGLLDAALDAGELELVEGFAYPLPVTIISDMLGVPEDDREAFRDWSRALARGLDPDFLLPPDVVEARDAAIFEFRDWFDELAASRRADPGDDLLSALIAAEDEGDRLTHDELLTTCMLLLTAGHETTVNLVGNAVLALLRHPDEYRRLGEDPGRARDVVEETLRYDPPVQMTIRVALDETELAPGVTLAAGDQAVLLLAAANRDPAQFPDPDRFDPARGDARHLAFGGGPHFCLGAPLARVEAQVAVSAIARRIPDLEISTDEPPYRENLVLRGLAALPVRW